MLGVSGTITGIALAISLIVDAVVDPIAGSLSDRLRSRWGRRHPFILLSAIPLGGCFFLIFNPPGGFGEIGLAAWLVVWTLATRIALTFFHVPHLALGAEMAHDYNQRSTMYSYNTFFGIVGQAIGVAFAYYAFFPTTEQYNPGLLNPHGYVEFSSVFGVCIVVAIAVCVLGTWREIPHLPTSGRSNAALLPARRIPRNGRRVPQPVVPGVVLRSEPGDDHAVGRRRADAVHERAFLGTDHRADLDAFRRSACSGCSSDSH